MQPTINARGCGKRDSGMLSPKAEGVTASLQMTLHVLLTGGIRLHAIDSFIPWARGPQAAVCASRVASASEAADAVAVFCALPNATVTVHSTRCDDMVDQSRKPAKASTTSRIRRFPGRVKPASL